MTYRVWRKDVFLGCKNDDERHDMAWTIRREVETAGDAAQAYADHCHARLGGWEWTWPVDFVVHDGERYWEIEVERHTVPEFVAGKARAFVLTSPAELISDQTYKTWTPGPNDGAIVGEEIAARLPPPERPTPQLMTKMFDDLVDAVRRYDTNGGDITIVVHPTRKFVVLVGTSLDATESIIEAYESLPGPIVKDSRTDG